MSHGQSLEGGSVAVVLRTTDNIGMRSIESVLQTSSCVVGSIRVLGRTRNYGRNTGLSSCSIAAAKTQHNTVTLLIFWFESKDEQRHWLTNL